MDGLDPGELKGHLELWDGDGEEPGACSGAVERQHLWP